MTRGLAAQWGARKGIRVNALVPGFFVTEISQAYRPGYLDGQLDRALLKRAGYPAELATLVWLVSPAAGYVTGPDDRRRRGTNGHVSALARGVG